MNDAAAIVASGCCWTIEPVRCAAEGAAIGVASSGAIGRCDRRAKVAVTWRPVMM